MLALHLHERLHDRLHAQLVNVAAKDAAQQRCADDAKHFAAEVPLDKAGDGFVVIGRARFNFFCAVRAPRIGCASGFAEER